MLSVPAYQQAKVHPDTVKLLIRAESRAVRGKTQEARADLEEATSMDSRLVTAQAQLAVMYEQSQEYDKAIGRYRRLLELAPQSPLFLNNLAYALAVRKNQVDEALPLAEKAFSLGKGNASITDTLGWIYYLKGSKEKALPLLEQAVQADSQNAEINFHLACVYEAAGQPLQASQKLQRALELDPELAKRPEVQELKKKLEK